MSLSKLFLKTGYQSHRASLMKIEPTIYRAINGPYEGKSLALNTGSTLALNLGGRVGCYVKCGKGEVTWVPFPSNQ